MTYGIQFKAKNSLTDDNWHWQTDTGYFPNKRIFLSLNEAYRFIQKDEVKWPNIQYRIVEI